MSHLWRKLRDGKESAKPHTSQVKLLPYSAKSGCDGELPINQVGLVCPEIEKRFFPQYDHEVPDPLLEKPHYVTSLRQVLADARTRRYFFQYLDGNEKLSLASFWVDVTNLEECWHQNSPEHVDSQQENHETVHLSADQILLQKGYSKTRVLDDRPVLDCMQNNVVAKANGFLTVSNTNDLFLLDNSTSLRSHLNNVTETIECNANVCDNTVVDIPNFEAISSPNCSMASSEVNGNKSKANSDLTLSGVTNDGTFLPFRIQTVGLPKTKVKSFLFIRRESTLFSEESIQVLVKEIWRIFELYIAVDSQLSCPLSQQSKKDIMNMVNRLHSEIDLNCFAKAKEEVLNALESEMPGFLNSDLHLVHQFDLLSHVTPSLADILHSHLAFPYFMEYLEQKNARPLLEFWVAGSNFRSHLLPALLKKSSRPFTGPVKSSENQSNISNQSHHCCNNEETTEQFPSSPCSELTADESQCDAMVIYDKFFSLQAQQFLGFSDSLRCHIESNICSENGPEYSCFDLPLRAVYHTMDKHYMPQFLTSNLYEIYVSDLASTAADASTKCRRRRTASGSTCDSDVTNSTSVTSITNTLLAMDTSAHGLRGVRSSSPCVLQAANLRIDNSLLQQPESLWRRNHQRGLSCGKVSALGRFVPELSPPPITRQEQDGKLKRTWKKFSNKDKLQARMDQAFSEAEQIIRGVTSVTMDPNNSPTNPFHPANPYDIALSQYSRHSSYFNGNKNANEGCCTSQQITGNHSNLTNLSSAQIVDAAYCMSSPSRSSMSKSSSGYNFSDIADNIFGSGSNCDLAHSYSLASFDLETEVDEELSTF